MRTMPAGASAAGLVGAMSTMCCGRITGSCVKAASGFAVIAAMRCIRAFIAALGSPGVARIAP